MAESWLSFIRNQIYFYTADVFSAASRPCTGDIIAICFAVAPRRHQAKSIFDLGSIGHLSTPAKTLADLPVRRADRDRLEANEKSADLSDWNRFKRLLLDFQALSLGSEPVAENLVPAKFACCLGVHCPAEDVQIQAWQQHFQCRFFSADSIGKEGQGSCHVRMG